MILIAESPSRRTEYRRYLGNAGSNSSTSGAAGTSVRRSLMPMLQQTTGEVRLADHKRRHLRAGVAVLTAISTNSRRTSSRTALDIASAGSPNYFLLTNRGSSGECRLNPLRRISDSGHQVPHPRMSAFPLVAESRRAVLSVIAIVPGQQKSSSSATISPASHCRISPECLADEQF